MHTLVVASQKGGSGKTTLCGHLAVEAEKAGAGPVALVDTDPQGSLSEWWNVREAGAPVFVKVGSLEIEAALARLADAGIKLAVVDTPPAITGAISYVVSCADLVLVPTRPSPHDLRAVGATVDIADHHGKGVVFVINDATARARITAESAIALSQHGVVAPAMIHNRVDFAASMIDGRTVGEITPQSKSAEEIRALWAYVAGRLERVQSAPRAMVAPPPPQPSLLLGPMPDDDLFDVDPPSHDLFALRASPAPAPVLATTPMTGDPDTQPHGAPAAAVAMDHGAAAPDAGEASTVLVDRRSGPDRRGEDWQPRPTFGDRRIQHPFGRRSTDRTAERS